MIYTTVASDDKTRPLVEIHYGMLHEGFIKPGST